VSLKTDSKKRLRLVHLAGFLLAVHFASVAYINSSLLLQFVIDSTLNILYVVGSILSVCTLIFAPTLLRKYGSIWVFIAFLALEILAVFGMGLTNIASLAILFFLIHIAADSILYLCLDINLEQEIKIEGETGGKRGTLLAISQIAWVLSPLALIFLINQNTFSKVYLLSGVALIPLLFIVSIFFKNIQKTDKITSSISKTTQTLFRGGDKARIIGAQLILNFFYAWMVINLPLLLSRELGFGWDKIGLLFIIMLLPFLLFELPAGLLADKKIGEKELLIIGFITMALATFMIPLISVKTFWIWALILFASRVGAALVEASSEIYFFKHVKEEDTGLISLFRMTRPLSYIISPLFALPVIYFFSYATSFYFLAFFVVIGLFFIPKVDTK
jgi:MFS family permease